MIATKFSQNFVNDSLFFRRIKNNETDLNIKVMAELFVVTMTEPYFWEPQLVKIDPFIRFFVAVGLN